MIILHLSYLKIENKNFTIHHFIIRYHTFTMDYIEKIKRKHIIAVGYELHFPVDEVKKAISTVTDIEEYKFIDTYKAGIYFGKSSRMGDATDVFKDNATLVKWYESRKSKELTAYIRSIYVVNKLIVAKMDCNGDHFFVVISNMTHGTQTTFHKVNCVRGHYGKPVNIERISVKAKAYIYEC